MDKITTVQCVICNTTFQPRRNKRDGVQKCCSNKCRGILRTKMKRLYPRVCMSCGKDFITHSRGKTGVVKYCSLPCVSAGYKKNAINPVLLEKRLMAKRKIDPETGCWEWVGCFGAYGYGSISVSHASTSPHRLITYLYLGMPLDSPAFVCHTCDNRACFNPEHLYIGDAKTNAHDRKERGRSNQVCGEKHGRSKLTEAQVKGIILLLNEGHSHTKLSVMFGVSRPAISLISLNETWKHLPRFI